MRSFPRFAFLRWFALAAMLLLTFAPSISRWLAASEGGSGWVQLCSMSGLKQVWLDGGTLPAKGDHAGDDCAYCPLLGAMAAAAVFAWLATAERRNLAPQRRFATLSISRPIAGSLGARGPPFLA